MIYVIIVIILLLITVAIASWSSAPFVPTRTKDLPRILKLAQMEPGQTFYDLGCGNAKVVKYIAENTEAKAIGIEMAVPVYVWAKLKQIFSGLKNFQVIYNSFFKVDLRDADVVYIFGYPTTLKEKVAVKLKKDLKPGAKILTYAFNIPGWQPILKDQPTKNDMPIYVYQK